MVELVKAKELHVKEYVASIGLNPQNVYYQRIRSNNVSTEIAQWNVKTPNPRAMLLSFAQIHWKPTITSQVAGADDDFVRSNIKACFKPGLPFANATSSVRCQINSSNMSMARPSRFMEILGLMYSGREGAKKYWSAAGGEPWSLDGQVGSGPVGSDTTLDFAITDKALYRAEKSFKEKLLKATNYTTLHERNNFQVSCIEPVIAPPFNPFCFLKDEMPDYSWFKKMSPMVANVNSIDLDYQFTKLSESVLFSRFMQSAAATTDVTLKISALQADLLLYWYTPPMAMSVPREISYQAWDVREFPSPIAGAGAGGAITVAAPTVTGIESQLIQLKEMPSLIVIHAEVDKDSATYVAAPLARGTGGAAAGGLAKDSLDDYLELYDVEVILGDKPQVINTYFTQEELYQLTLKNSKHIDFPYTYNEWKGSVGTLFNAGGFTSFNQMGKCFLAFRPEDLNSEYSDGVNVSTTLQFRMNARRHGDIAGYRALLANTQEFDKKYTLYVHTFFGKRLLTLTKELGQYSTQAIPMGAAQKMIEGGKSARVEDQEYVSRMPTP